MDQERNPNRNAELSMEQNGNMIDGIINNLPAPPPGRKAAGQGTGTSAQAPQPGA